MSNIKACLFDLDGVLVDTAKYHYLAWKRLCKELGINFTLEDNERLKGVGRMASLEIILNIGEIQLDNKTKLELADKKNNWYLEYISKITSKEILPGAKKFIELLKTNNYKIALGSASKNSMIILKKLNLVELFDVIIDGTKVSRGKPDPEVFLKAAKELKIPPENCLVFEDSLSGIKAAKNAQMYSIGIGSYELLKDADLIVSGLDKMTLKLLNLF